MSEWQASLGMLKNPALMQYLLRGVVFTLMISLVAVALGVALKCAF